jgi:hypothetical protein
MSVLSVKHSQQALSWALRCRGAAACGTASWRWPPFATGAAAALHVCLLQSRELKEKRAQFLQQEQLLKEEAATKRYVAC